MGNVDWDDSANKDKFLRQSWIGKNGDQTTGDLYKDNSSRTLAEHSYTANGGYYVNVLWENSTTDYAYNSEGQILDGNRYVWLDQLENFSNTSSKAARDYPWAGRGMSWRGSDWSTGEPKESSVEYRNGERCWYIPIREEGLDKVHGILCIWDPDRKTDKHPANDKSDRLDYRPYHGAPFLLNLKLARQRLNVWYENNDQFFSLAFSDNGRSYILRQGNYPYSNKPGKDKDGNTSDKNGKILEPYWIYPTEVTGSAHIWHPNKKDLSSGLYSQNGKLPGNPCNLINVKGNLGYTVNKPGKYSTTDYNKMTSAYVYMLPTYNDKDENGNWVDHTTIRVRREKVTDLGYVGATRFNLTGASISEADYNYVIPIAGAGRSDFLVQMKNNKMLYVPHAVAANAAEGNSCQDQNVSYDANGVTGWRYVDFSMDFKPLVGGCSFVFKGETFLVLPAARHDKDS